MLMCIPNLLLIHETRISCMLDMDIIKIHNHDHMALVGCSYIHTDNPHANCLGYIAPQHEQMLNQ